ncbi:MAG: metal-dependent phosphohydrolase [Gallionellales bacterium GWA2_59_43]|nr:MAG: metal-dependent phosphohydrolase [Gallionellales bacterium GWA2_59_43]
MTDIQALTRPEILDQEALHEFSDALTDYVPNIERDMARLGREPTNRVVIADIFRALHNIKGDAALCRVETAALIAHPIESLLTRLRSGEAAYTPLLGEVMLLALDRLELATEALLVGRSIESLRLVTLVEGLEQISLAGPQEIDAAAIRLIKSVTGFQPQATLRAMIEQPLAPSKQTGGRAADLQLFHTLALQFETRSPLFAGRTGRVLQLALDTNRAAGSPVDAVQLEAAACMHDVGMMFLPEAVWLKVGKMSEAEREILHVHPGLAADLLDRMDGWQDAARMVRQHQEMWDGAGYPDGLRGDAICAGAKILAIVDAFEAVTLKHSTRGHKRSVLRAIAEVNACDRQFAPEWIEPFNGVIRRMLEQ